jgi:hypothetical protein
MVNWKPGQPYDNKIYHEKVDSFFEDNPKTKAIMDKIRKNGWELV